MKSVIRRSFLRLSTVPIPILSSVMLTNMKQSQVSLFAGSSASFIELLPRIDLNTRSENRKQRLPSQVETDDASDIATLEELEEEKINGKAILQISTFKRKKPKMRKDRARTIRRKIKRKSAKKRAKYNL